MMNTKKSILKVGLFAILLFLLIDCKHSSIVPSSPVISYRSGVQPILVGNCTLSGCHDSNSHEGPKLLTYQDLMQEQLIVAGNPNDSKLYKSITGKTEEFMPKSPVQPLDEQALLTIYLWIAQGAKNN